MKRINRRHFHGYLGKILSSAVLLRAGFANHAFAQDIAPNMKRWYRDLDAIGRAVKDHRLTPEQWRKRIEALHGSVSLEDLLRFIDFQRLIDGLTYPERWGAIRDVRFPRIPGLPDHIPGAKIFAYRKHAATSPHGHNNMVSAHLIVKGLFHVRTYHRVRDEEGYLILEPAIDRIAGPGEVVTMSDESHNVHWFTAASDHAYTLDVPVTHLKPGKHYATPANKYGMIWVDPTAGVTNDGYSRARVIGFQEAERRFARK
jgi:hypothetical protein